MAFFKTTLAVLFRTFGPLRFESVKPSFLYDHLTTQHSDFSIFLGISLTEKPVDRNTCFCWHVAECFFRRGGLSFRIFTQNKLGVRAFRATKCKKYMTGKFTRAAHLWREITQIEFRVKRGNKKYEILNKIESHNFGLNYVLIRSNRTALQTYKGDERTFGTPCILCRKCPGVVYIGETGRRLGDRFREHRLDVIKIKMALPVPAHFARVDHQLEDMQVAVIRAGLPEQDKRRREEMRFMHNFGTLAPGD